MSDAGLVQPVRARSVESFKAFWAKPQLSQVPGILGVVTGDIVGNYIFCDHPFFGCVADWLAGPTSW